MAKKYTDEFRRAAVRMAATSSLTCPQLSSDSGVDVSTLNKWGNNTSTRRGRC